MVTFPRICSGQKDRRSELPHNDTSRLRRVLPHHLFVESGIGAFSAKVPNMMVIKLRFRRFEVSVSRSVRHFVAVRKSKCYGNVI